MGDEWTTVLKIASAMAISAIYIWWLTLGYPCVGKNIHTTSSSHLLRL